jgi:hypothetical protein
MKWAFSKSIYGAKHQSETVKRMITFITLQIYLDNLKSPIKFFDENVEIHANKGIQARSLVNPQSLTQKNTPDTIQT